MGKGIEEKGGISLEERCQRNLNCGPILDAHKSSAKSIDTKLQKLEANMIKDYAEFLEAIEKIRNDFENKKWYFPNKSVELIENAFIDLEKIGTKNSIPYLEAIIKFEEAKINKSFLFNNNFRDLVESNIKFDVGNKDTEERFYKLFTKLYIDILDIKYSENQQKEILKHSKTGLYLTEKELAGIHKYLNDNFFSQIAHDDIKMIVTIYGNHKIPLKYIPKNGSNRISQKVDMTKLYNELSFEKNPNEQQYLKILTEKGLSENLKIIFELLIKKYLINSNPQIFSLEYYEKNKQKIIYNFLNFLKYIIFIESNGDPKAENPNSSAKGLFQYLIGNGKKGKYSSYETAIRCSIKAFTNITAGKKSLWVNSIENNLKYLNIDETKLVKDFLNKIKNEYSSKDKTPINLSEEEQVILFLSEIFTRPKIDNTEKAKNLFIKILNGDNKAMEDYYRYYHHTNPDEQTEKRMILAMQYYGNLIQIK